MTKNEIPTTEEIELMNGTALVALYNKLQPSNPVKRFATRQDGIKRLIPIADAARKVLSAKASPAKAASKAVEHIDTTPKAKKTAKASGPKVESVAGFMKGLIVAGKTNAEVWTLAQAKFDLPDEKKSYPAWYRRDLTKRGEI